MFQFELKSSSVTNVEKYKSQHTIGTDHLIFRVGGGGWDLKKIVCFRTGVKKIKCLQES